MSTAQERWERRTEWPLAGAALLFLAAYTVQVLHQSRGTEHRVTEGIMLVAWVLFAVDFAMRFWLAEQRRRWLVQHLHELAIIVLPILRPLRLLRLVMLVGVLQHAVGGAFRGRVITYTAATSVLLVFVASLAMLEAERGHGGPIGTFPEALWWAITTITTVGYGDYIPATATGRCVAVALMLGGIGLIGVVSATLASWIVQRVSEDEAQQADTQIAALHNEVRELRRQLTSIESHLRAQSRIRP